MRPRSLAVAACSAFLLLVISLLVLTTPAPTIAAPGDVPSGGLAKGHAKDVVLVGFEPGTSKVKKGVAAGSVGATDVEPLSPLAPDTVVMKLPPGQTVEKAIEKLQKQSGVRYAEPDYYVTTAETSNDTYYADGSLWGMHGDALSPYASPFGSGADEAWAAGAVGSKAVYVGIVDEGVQIDHPDLVDNIWTNPFEIAGNGIDDDGNGYVDDIHGWDFNSGDATVYDGTGDDHGTHVAGTIGARGGNGIGVAGVDWKVTLIPVKFLGPSGGSISSAIAAIDYVSDLKTRHGLNIVATNNSWGYLHTAAMGTPSQALADAIDRGGDRGILFIAAAGNDGKLTKTSDSTPSFLPAGYSCSTRADGSARGWDCIISVANIDSGGGLATTSNYGSASVDLGAPGSSIRSTYPGGYADMSGTSMATPHVTGALALCASLDPGLGAGVLRSRLLGSGTQTASLLGKTVTGDRLDIGALVRECGVSVPNIVDKLEATALTDLTAAGLVAGGRSEAYHGTIVAGRVINSTPTAGAMVPPGSTVSYVVSLGIEQVTVPNIVGLTETAADSALTGVGLAPGAKTSAYSTTVAKDSIISQAPAAAATVAKGSTVSYVVSLGIEQVTVPNIVGLTETAADSALTGVGLAPGAKTSAYSTTVAKDSIISQAPAAAATVAKGSTVSYVVSLGIEQVTVPNIVGLTETAADSALTGVGLAPGAKTSAYSTTVAKDLIISQAPAAAATVAKGSTVSYVVSLGIEQVTVPNIVGLTETAADSALTGVGLAPGAKTSAYSTTVALDQVFDQLPTAGQQVPPGSAVSYSVSLGPPPVLSTPAPTPAPTLEPTPAPQPEPAAVTVAVDDLSPQFIARAGGWKEARSGYLRHSVWVPTRAGKAKRIATWRPTLTAPGDYRVVVKVPPTNATTKRAVYRVKSTDGWVKRPLDQSANRGKWVDLGTFRLTTTPAVKLTDRTGERASLGRTIGFDAVRFVPAGPRVASDAETPDSPAPPDSPLQGPIPEPARATEPTPEPTADRTADAAASPPPGSGPTADHTPEPAPERTEEPEARPTPAPTTQPAADPTREPTPEPTRAPDPTPDPTPEPVVTPARDPDPTPDPTPEPNIQSVGEPSSEPASSPAAG